MDFPRLETQLRHPPERVRSALLGNELEPYFKESGWLTQGSAGRGIRWSAQPDGSLLGKVGYFRSKNLSAFRFKVQLEPAGSGTRAVLLAQHGPFSPLLRFLLYGVGLLMCLVGVVFSYLGDKAIQRGLSKVVEYLERHLKMWDEAAR
jgi:hypothetical protein